MPTKSIRCPFAGAETSLCQAIGEEIMSSVHGAVIVFHLLANGVVIGILTSGRKINTRNGEDFVIGDIVVFHRNHFELRHNSYFRSYSGADKDRPSPLEDVPYERIEYGYGVLGERRQFVHRGLVLNEYPKI